MLTKEQIKDIIGMIMVVLMVAFILTAALINSITLVILSLICGAISIAMQSKLMKQ